MASLATSLEQLSDTVLPTWSHAGRPALTTLFAQLRGKMEEDGLCFRSADETKGREWMLGVMQVLYDLSTFHGKLAERSARMPARFEFSCGANDHVKKGKPAPKFDQKAVRLAFQKLMPLHLSPALDHRWTSRAVG